MKLRIARHTNQLIPIIDFYTNLLGLQVLGSFEGHDGYDGVFIGHPLENWQLEFTVSDRRPAHIPDDDDLLVFYCDAEQSKSVIAGLKSAGYLIEKAKNPYWNANGLTFIDPDGYRTVITAI